MTSPLPSLSTNVVNDESLTATSPSLDNAIVAPIETPAVINSPVPATKLSQEPAELLGRGHRTQPLKLADFLVNTVSISDSSPSPLASAAPSGTAYPLSYYLTCELSQPSQLLSSALTTAARSFNEAM
ncbi:unnamed protein product [Microthlaspi erraticum]|uniref:Uncharacterized protein n=1 Tax=Microthlaspi erraticum TaxID=1685480 RepID=A0A6D2JU07_9BRAS|nr:unnamed protein product [Microthlaspi erraticum]